MEPNPALEPLLVLTNLEKEVELFVDKKISDWAEVVREGFVRAAKGAGLPQHFIDGIRVEVEDEGFLVYNNWTGYNETRKTQTPLATFFIKGTRDHWIFPVIAKALHWAIGDKNFFSKGHKVRGLRPSTAWRVGEQIAIEMVLGRMSEDIRASIFHYRSGAV